MTICVATIADKNTLIAACDRMVTAGDVEFEPDQAKIWALSSSIVALLSGDLTKQAEILKEVQTSVQDWIIQSPAVQVSVADVVRQYCQEYRKVLRYEAERDILSPFNLDIATYLANQTCYTKEFVDDIAARLMAYEFPVPLQTIIMGQDNDGPLGNEGQKLIYTKLYSIEGDRSSLRTTIGFAAIGAGRLHAESEIMVKGHAPAKPLHQAIFLTYAAKKRAEVAPGVGKFTDMVVMGPGLNNFLKVEDQHVAALEKIYSKNRESNIDTLTEAWKEAEEFVKQTRKYYEEKAKKSKDGAKENPPTQLDDQKSV